LLTEDDLTAIADGSRDAAATIRALISAVDDDQLADPSDAGYAIALAADVAEAAGDTSEAVALARRAVALADETDPEYLYPHGLLARLLGAQGDREAADAMLERLRAALTTKDQAAHVLAEAAESMNAQQTALNWLTEALDVLAPDRDDLPLPGRGFEIVAELLMARHDLREGMGLPHDADDELADRIDAAFAEAVEDLIDLTMSVLFFPQNELEGLYLLAPAMASLVGQSWDEHRARVQLMLTANSDAGISGQMVVAAAAEGYLRFAADEEMDPADPTTINEYADFLVDEEDEGVRPWPPGRNDPCWCGSGLKYKKCCLRRVVNLPTATNDQQ
jgi:tetratricopeptide (TPR) repeat protein